MAPRCFGVTYHGGMEEFPWTIRNYSKHEVILPRSAGSTPTLDIRSLPGPFLHRHDTWARAFLFSQHGSRSVRSGPFISLKRKYRCRDIHSDRSSLLAPTSSRLENPESRARYIGSLPLISFSSPKIPVEPTDRCLSIVGQARASEPY